MKNIGHYTIFLLLAGFSPVGLCEEDRRTVEDKRMAGWMDSSEWLSWKVKILRPGTYDVMLDSTAMAGESEVTVTANDATLTDKLPKTENWDDYQKASIGQLTFKEAGVFTLSFKPASAATWRPLNLRNVMLNGNEN